MSARPGPIFIGGPDRCGKTLLAGLLGSHSRISIPVVGSNLWPLFSRQHGDLRDLDNARRCLDAMLGYKHIAFLQPDREAVIRAFVDGPRTYAHLFAAVQEQHATRNGKPRWGDQTGLVERYADEIFESYPDVRFVHMVRDPRDRYAESRARWPGGRLGAGGATARWLFSVRLGQRNARRHGDRYRLLRYETLVTDPEGTVRDLCAFLGEAFEPSMLELGAVPTYRAKLEASIETLPSEARPASGLPISPACIHRRLPRSRLALGGRLHPGTGRDGDGSVRLSARADPARGDGSPPAALRRRPARRAPHVRMVGQGDARVPISPMARPAAEPTRRSVDGRRWS
jgi:hypothetical protein